MSAVDPFSSLSSLSSLASPSPSAAGGLPIVSQASEPAAIRNGGKTAQNAYNTGLQFESILVNELTQALTATAGLSADDSSGDDSDGSDGSDGVLGSDPASAEYAQLLPGALSSSIMSSGGLGLAMPIAQSLDPSLLDASAATALATTPSAATTPAATTSATTGQTASIGGVATS